MTAPEPETPEDHAATVDRAFAAVLPLSETYEIPVGGSVTISFDQRAE